jgi:MoaA/NifB/PqqE/SkfB family radical SAM enzyme
MVERLTGQLNTVPVLSIEGNQHQTDDRRGAGVHARLAERMETLRKAGIFFSLSITITRENFDTVTDAAFLRRAVEAGCRFFLLLEYTPIREGTDDWVITEEQRERMKGIVAAARRELPAVFTAVPWDEEAQGGCLAAGRGFVHISATGDVEPCPFAPYSDASLTGLPLRQALQSPFLASMRANHEMFAETQGGCALWKNRDTVESLLQPKGA